MREIDHIMSVAAERGLRRGQLAAKAGLPAETLSRLLRKDDCRLETLRKLADALGLEIALVSKRRVRDAALTLAAKKLSAGRRREIAPAELAAVLSGRGDWRPWRGHLYGLLEELPIESVHDLVIGGHATFPRLLAIANELGAEGETVAWIKEMAGDGVAPAA